MTLQEIFKSVRFEDMVKYLIDIESQVFENLYCFKEAFDVLRMMEAKEGKNIPIEIEKKKISLEGNSALPLISAILIKQLVARRRKIIKQTPAMKLEASDLVFFLI